MSSVAAPPHGATTALTDLDAINDEERLRVMWQTAEDFGDRRRIRARMYRLREQRLREMMQNDEESLGSLNIAEDDSNSVQSTETTINVSDDGKTTTRRSSNIQVTMHVDGDKAVTESISTQNVRLGGLTMRGIDADDIIQERIEKASKDRTARYQIIKDLCDNDSHSDGDAVVSITKSTYSIHSNALAGEGYISMKNKEVRDSVSPTRIMRERRSSAEEDASANEGRLTSDDEAVLKSESENVIKAIEISVPKTSSSRKTSRDERTSSSRTSTKSKQSEIPVRKESTRKISERKTSRELDLSSAKRATVDKSSPTSPTKRTPGETTTKTSHASRKGGAQKEATTTVSKATSKTSNKTATSTRKDKLADIEAKMETSIMSELDKLDTYLNASVDDDDEVIMEEEEDCVDESGNVVKMLVQTRRKKDGTECTARRVARSTKIVNSESEIDEILIGNPEHEVIERNVAEEEDKDGNKIKIITETRQRPDGIVYTTKNILKTSKIFDYDHPEDIAYSEEDELISTDQTEETDENGCKIQTVTETRRKANGVEYTTKKVYKTSKVKSTQLTPSDDDEIIDTKESEEKKEDGTIIRTIIETRRTKNGEEYTHRQVLKSRRMTLSGVDVQKGLPTVQNDDEILDKKEKEETDENGMKIKIVTETRRRQDGSTYSFDYVLRSFQGTEEEMKNMPISASSGNIAVSAEDELLNEEVKEEIQEDGSTVKTIIERRRAKDGTEYLRHRVMRIPKMPEPVFTLANLEDEVLQEEVNEETLDDGTQYKAVTERRRSSVSGVQYTLRRMSRVYQQAAIHPKANEDEILDENVAEEETDDGTIIKTIIQRYQRPDGSVYTTHNIHKMFSSPAPVTFVGTEDDELVDQTVDEQETEDGCVIKTVTETRRRSDGVQYTVERAEKSTKYGPQVHVTFNASQPQKPEDVVQVGSPEDTVVSSEEQEYEEEDGTTVKTTIEIRRRVDGTEYTAKTVLRSTPVLVPERETSYVVIKPEGGDEEDESGLFPSLNDEIVYTRKREEKDEYGNAITVVIETRQTKSGEKYNITKRVHTKDVLLTEEGEKEIPRKTMKSTLVANLKTRSAPDQKKPKSSETTVDTQDDVPYGSVTALKNRFAVTKKPESSSPSPKYSKPDRLNTSSKKKFFEEAAKEASGKVTTSKSFTPKPLKIKKELEEDKVDLVTRTSKEKASIEVKLRVEEEKAKVEDVETHNVTYSDSSKLEDTVAEMDLEEQHRPEDMENLQKEPETEPEPEAVEEPKEESSEPEPDLGDSSPAEEEPQEVRPKKVEKAKKPSSLSKKPEEKPRRRQDLSPKKKPEPNGSPTRRTPSNREPITPKESPRRAPKPVNISPQRVPSSPRRGRSPNRSGVSTPREVTPTGRQCCKRHREANANPPENISPTRTQKSPRSTVPSSKKPGSPEGKPKMNGDVKRSPESKMNGDVSRKPDDRTSRTRRPWDRTNEPEKTSTRPSRLNQSPRKSPTSKSPEKREPTRPLSTRGSDKKVPSKSTDSEPKGKPKSSLNLPEPADPVVSLPETPMTEGMKPLQVDDENFVIEDVSDEPDLPYHKIHRPSLVREPSEYPDEEGEQPDDAFVEESPDERDEKEPVKEDIVSSRKPKPLESRPGDKSPTSKKQPETKKPVRDRPWLTEKRNSLEKKPSETKLSSDKKKLFERKPSDDKLKKLKDEKKPTKETQPEDSAPSEDENKENGFPETEDVPSQDIPDKTDKISKKAEDISSRLLEDIEKSIESEIITEKNVSTAEVSARRTLFSRSSPDKKKDTPTRKPSYEIKESIFAKRSMFEQPKQDSVPSPVRRPTLKTTLRKDDSYKKQEEPKPVKEPLIVPKYVHPLGENEEEPEKKVVEEDVRTSSRKIVEEEVKLSSSKLVMNASAEITKTKKKSVQEKAEDEDNHDEDNLAPLKKERSPSPFSKEGSPAPRSKERSPSPFNKEGSPTRFATGKPVDSGINSNKIRRIERTASNKKLFEDLEVSRETLPEYIKNIDNIFDVVVLESMLEQAQTYEERRLIRGQIRIAKKQSTSTTTTSSTTSTSYKRFIEPSQPTPTASPQPAKREDTKPLSHDKPRDTNLTETSNKPFSRSEDSQTSPRDEGDSLPAEEPISPRRKISAEAPAVEAAAPEPDQEPRERTKSRFGRRTYRDPSPETIDTRDSIETAAPEPDQEPKERTKSRFGRRTYRDLSPETIDTRDSPRSRKSDDELSSPREPKREVKSEEPKKYESPLKTRETPKPNRFLPVTPKAAAPSNEPYVEPLRYQKKQGGSTPSKSPAAQSDVDKIVSAYGLGPTDDNGMPLFGLRALKKRSPAAPSESVPKEEEKPAPSATETSEPDAPADQAFEPTDASGLPIFGLRALKKATSSVNATERAIERSEVQETRETASSSVVESSRLVSGIVTQRQTHATELVSSESPREYGCLEVEQPQEVESDQEAQPLEPYYEEETSPGLVRSLRDSFRRRETSEDLQTSTGKAEDEVILNRSQPLRDILKLHEAKVQEPTTAEESPRLKPKQRLRENFEAPERQDSRVHKTWDMESDLSTRSLNMKNIIARHETITSEASPKPEKKLTGILKKTSSTNLLGTDKISCISSTTERSSHETNTKSSISEQVNTAEDILETLTEDQITRLSEEFDLRAQDDGVIKTEESMEELAGGYRVSSRATGEYPDGAKFERKTSYTEIKLQQPNREERSRVVTSSSTATVEHSSDAAFSSRDSHNGSSSVRRISFEEGDASEMREGRSFLEDRSKVTGFGDVLSRMGATEAVDHEAKVTSDDQARSLLNKFLGAQVLMTGVESMMASSSISESSRTVTDGDGVAVTTKQASGHNASAASKDGALTHHSSKSFNTGPQTVTGKTSSSQSQALEESVIVGGVNISEVTDDFELNQLLDSCDQYEDRRKIRMRLKSLMAEKKALHDGLSGHDVGRGSRTQGSSAQKFEAMSKTNNYSKESNLRSSEGDAKASSTMSPFGTSRTSTTDTRSSSQVNVQKSSYSSNVSSSTTSSFKTSSVSKAADSKSVVSPFDKFKQMDTQTPRTPNSKSKSAGGGPLFQLSSQLSRSASGVKDMLLQWCQCRTRDYKGIKIENFSTSWNDGMAFCALIHHFYPDAFDFDKLDPKNRRYNFDLAFRVADEKAGIYPLLDVEDMVMMKKPDWKCVFTYVQALYKRLKDE